MNTKRSTSELDAPRAGDRLRGVALLPAAATLGNLLSGLLAIVCCLFALRATVDPKLAGVATLGAWFPSPLALGGYLIVLALIFDALDGRLARLMRRTTEFGAQLDSLADIVSFGIAPVALLLTLVLQHGMNPGAAGGEPVSAAQWRLTLVCGLVFTSCAAIRLARFHVENTEHEEQQHRFSGLPTPGGAGGIVALIILHEDLFATSAAWLGVPWPDVVRYALGPTALLLGILMVSRLDYIHVFNVYVRREQPPTHLVALVLLVAVGIWWISIMLVALAFAYILSGLALNFVFHARDRRAPVAPSQSDAADRPNRSPHDHMLN